jgi:NAD-dependent dihydropyrimidine dehydrogenase PreA subunit
MTEEEAANAPEATKFTEKPVIKTNYKFSMAISPADCMGCTLCVKACPVNAKAEKDGTDKKIAYNAGLHLGKWIYVADALDDAKEDKKNSRFNPFIRLYGGEIPNGEQLYDIELALRNELFGLEAALDLIDYGDNITAKEIIQNVIYLGMPKKIEDICKKYKE